MEERGLKVLENNTTFLNKLSNTITKLLIPTKVGINGMMINIKRNNVIKILLIFFIIGYIGLVNFS